MCLLLLILHSDYETLDSLWFGLWKPYIDSDLETFHYENKPYNESIISNER